jgi:hypothetical protein
MPYINTIDINGVIYTLENLTDGNNIVTLPTLSRDDVFVLRGNIVNNTSSTSATQPLSANQGRLLRNDLNTEIQNRTNDVNLEEERATEAERVLATNLNKEISDRKADVDAEETRAKSAENTLTTNLNAEIARAKKAEADELARAKAAEKVLTDNLAKEVTNRTNDVNAEETRALAAEKVLTDNLSAEVTRATNKENEINTALTNEVSRATGSENTLTSNLNAEISRAKAAESANSTAISTEKSRAEGVESGLASRIATMEAFFKEADIDASQDFIDTLKEIQSYIESDKTGAAAMTASINANKAAIETEATTAREAEKVNSDAISALTTKYNNEIVTKVDKVDGMGLSSNDYTDAEKTKLSGVEAGANKYEHPQYQYTYMGFYKFCNDQEGHIEDATYVTKDDITNLGIPGQDTTYDVATDTADGLLSATDKVTYDGYAATIADLQSQIDALRSLIESYHTVVEETQEELTE